MRGGSRQVGSGKAGDGKAGSGEASAGKAGASKAGSSKGGSSEAGVRSRVDSLASLKIREASSATCQTSYFAIVAPGIVTCLVAILICL